MQSNLNASLTEFARLQIQLEETETEPIPISGWSFREYTPKKLAPQSIMLRLCRRLPTFRLSKLRLSKFRPGCKVF